MGFSCIFPSFFFLHPGDLPQQLMNAAKEPACSTEELA